MNSPFEMTCNENNPLELVEEFVESKGWEFSRPDESYLNISLPGKYSDLDLNLEWQEEFSALLIACSIPVEITPQRYETVTQALEKINQNLWLGHFDLSNKNKYPTFRHTLVLSMIPTNFSANLVTYVTEIAKAECDRFHATFKQAQDGDTNLHDGLQAVVFETVGAA